LSTFDGTNIILNELVDRVHGQPLGCGLNSDFKEFEKLFFLMKQH
jgi:hypothetical protein